MSLYSDLAVGGRKHGGTAGGDVPMGVAYGLLGFSPVALALLKGARRYWSADVGRSHAERTLP